MAHDAVQAPAISIVLCTYNGERFLPAQLDSLLAQDDRDFEIVAVDDASRDRTASILQEYSRRDSRLRVVIHGENVGLQRNFERALSLARGALVAPCDQDDVWMHDKLRQLRAHLGQATMAYCDSQLIDAQSRPLGRRVSDRYRMITGSDARPFAFGNCVSGHAMLFRRELLESALPLPAGVYYDWWLACVAAMTGGIIYVDRCLVQFRQHGNGASRFEKTLAGPLRRLSRWQRYVGEQRALDALASRAPGPQREFFGRLSSLWRTRKDEALSPALVLLLMRHSRALYAMRRGPGWLKWRHALKHFRGFRGIATI